MSQVILQNGSVTTPEQLRTWVIAHPVQIRRYIYLDDLEGGYKTLAQEWTEAAAASKSKEVREFVRLVLADIAELLKVAIPIFLLCLTIKKG